MPKEEKGNSPPAPTSSASKQRIVIDPVTRIEGHLKIEVKLDKGEVKNAWSSGTLFRGVETILKGRDPEDAWLFTQRVCGVCTYVHGASSVRCVEDALDVTIPSNARTIRNLLMGGQFIHDHLVHFYHLHALDWVDIVNATRADAAATADLARSLSPDAPQFNFKEVKDRLQNFINSGQLGLFSGGYWDHSAYSLTPEENLLFVAHYFEMLHQQVEAARMHAIFGAKNPHLQSLRVGGVTCKYDINRQRIDEFRRLLTDLRTLIDTVYVPDVIFLAAKYPAWLSIGGYNNYLSYGEFALGESEPQDLFFERGAIFHQNIAGVEAIDIDLITEDIHHSWYAGDAGRHPSQGETVPDYNGYDTDSQYSWLKAPRYSGQPMEVGPLARMLVAYGSGNQQVCSSVDSFLATTDLSLQDLHSTLGRVAARALETQIIANAMDKWLDALSEDGDTRLDVRITDDAAGVGLNEAPRGALGHWISIEDRKISNYQMVVPSTWNLGPRCAADIPGPLETALIGTPVADSQQPVEILRTIHSFDPCIACAVHVIDTRNNQTYIVKAL